MEQDYLSSTPLSPEKYITSLEKDMKPNARKAY
jgi:hypothetical protein